MNNNKDINITINDLEEVIDPSIKKTNNTSIKKKQTKKKTTTKKRVVINKDTIDNKSKYKEWLEEDGLLRIEAWSREGLPLEQIAKCMGINPATLWKWRKKYDTIGNALKKTREIVIIKAENSLFKRVSGYNIFLKKPMKIKTGQYTEEIVYVDEEIHIMGDVGAQIFTLTNMRPEVWQNTQKNKVMIAEETSSILKAFSKHLQDNKNNSVDLSSDVAELNETNEDLETTE